MTHLESRGTWDRQACHHDGELREAYGLALRLAPGFPHQVPSLPSPQSFRVTGPCTRLLFLQVKDLHRSQSSAGPTHPHQKKKTKVKNPLTLKFQGLLTPDNLLTLDYVFDKEKVNRTLSVFRQTAC